MYRGGFELSDAQHTYETRPNWGCSGRWFKAGEGVVRVHLRVYVDSGAGQDGVGDL